MTGEITLRGRVLPIGGLKEKSLAAHRAGIKKVLMPKENERDLRDIPDSVRPIWSSSRSAIWTKCCSMRLLPKQAPVQTH